MTTSSTSPPSAHPSKPPTPFTPPRPPLSDADAGGPPDSGVSFALRRRSLLVGGLGMAAAGVLMACGSGGADATPSGFSTATGSFTGTDGTDADAGGTASGPEYHEASASNTPLSAGTWSGTIGDKQVTLSGAYLVDGITATIDGGTFESTAADQTVFLVVNGGSLSITNARIAKSGDASTDGQHGVDDSYNFYGLNSAVVTVGEGSAVTVGETTLTTNASGANAIIATGAATATVTACAIATTGESSRGLHATYAGVINGSDLAIETRGAHCAAVATDRGSGTVTVDGANTFTTNGDGSPCLYSTGRITVSGLTGRANASQAVVVEGRNHAVVSDSTLTSLRQGRSHALPVDVRGRRRLRRRHRGLHPLLDGCEPHLYPGGPDPLRHQHLLAGDPHPLRAGGPRGPGHGRRGPLGDGRLQRRRPGPPHGRHHLRWRHHRRLVILHHGNDNGRGNGHGDDLGRRHRLLSPGAAGSPSRPWPVPGGRPRRVAARQANSWTRAVVQARWVCEPTPRCPPSAVSR